MSQKIYYDKGVLIKLTEKGKKAYDTGIGSHYNLRNRAQFGVITFLNFTATGFNSYIASFFDKEGKTICKDITLIEEWCELFDPLGEAMRIIEEGLSKLEERLKHGNRS